MVLSSLLAGAAGGATVTVVINAIDNASSVFAGVNKSLLITSAAMVALGTAGVVAITNFTSTAIDFESAFAGVRKTVDLTEAQFDDLNDRFKDMTKEVPLTYEELAKIGELAGQLGVEGVDDLEKFTKTIADISATTNLTAEDAATSFARIANIMQEPISNVDKMGSVVVDLGNNFATTEAEIVNFATRIAGAGNIAGFTTKDILGIGAAMSSVGVQAEAGGTAVQKVLIDMNTAVATGGEKLDIFAKTAGMSSDEFSKMWETNAQGAFAAFVTGLGTQGDQAITTLSDLGLEDQRLIRSFLSLANAGDLINETLDTSQTAWEENTALVEEANKRYETAKEQLKMFKNRVALLANTMGEVFIPVLLKVLEYVNKFLDFLDEHPKLTKFAAVVLGIGSALLIVVGAILAVVALKAVLIPVFVAAAGAIWGAVTASLAFVAVNIWWIAIAALIVGAIILIIKYWDQLSVALINLGTLWVNVFKGIANVVLTVWNFIMNYIESKINSMIKLINKVIRGLNKIPGIDINKLSSVSLDSFKGDMIDYTAFTDMPSSNSSQAASVTVVNIDGDVNGTDPDQMAEAFATELNKTIRL